MVFLYCKAKYSINMLLSLFQCHSARLTGLACCNCAHNEKELLKELRLITQDVKSIIKVSELE